MAVSEEKTRVRMTLTKSPKAELDEMAKKDSPSLSNPCAKIISHDLKALKDGE